MSWALIDDQSTFHAKVVAAGNAGWGACVRMIAWSMAHLTDGVVPRHVANLIANDGELVALERAGLARVSETEVSIHDFLQWNKSAKQVRKERAAKAKAGKNGGLAKAAKAKQTAGSALAAAKAPAKALVGKNPAPSQASPSLSSPKRETEDPPYPPEGGAVSRVRSKPGPADEVYERFLAARQRHNPRLKPVAISPKDRKDLEALLRAGRTVDELGLAAEGLFLSPHHLGENDRKTPYLAFKFALRESNIDGFVALAEADRPATIERHPLDVPPPRPEHAAPLTPEQETAARAEVQAFIAGKSPLAQDLFGPLEQPGAPVRVDFAARRGAAR